MKWILYFISVFMLTLSLTYPVEGREDFCEDDWNGGVRADAMATLTSLQNKIDKMSSDITFWTIYVTTHPNDPEIVLLTQKLNLLIQYRNTAATHIAAMVIVYNQAVTDASNGEFCDAQDAVEGVEFTGHIDDINEGAQNADTQAALMAFLIGQVA